jgi:hypothetical protein
MRKSVLAMFAAVMIASGLSAADVPEVLTVADVHTLATPPLVPGQIELVTLSTFPDAVTGGDVLVELRGLENGDGISFSVNGEPHPTFVPHPTPAALPHMIGDLALGENTIAVEVSGPSGVRTAELTVKNHPISGPIISGPHQTPFRCRTAELGLGAPQGGELCFAPTRFEWQYFSKDSSAWKPLPNKDGPYPSDLAYTEMSSPDPLNGGRRVPFIARIETAIINRGVARMAVLDDPAHSPAGMLNWNGRVYHSFGESCGVGYDQGRSSLAHVLGGVPNPSNVSADNLFANLVGLLTRVGEGDVVVHSTLTAFGNHCNPFVSMETALMIKEHITETYGGYAPIDAYIGTGSSGGALQQYNAANNAPGLLDGAMPGASFADIATTAMTVTDCGLFMNYFASSTMGWNEVQKAAVMGHNTQSGTGAASICQSWKDAFLNRIDPTTACGGLSAEQRYHPVTNPNGSRCTVQDANVNWLGIDPETGFANRPIDNVGVQYGLQAFNAGLISFEQFADLNRRMGGYDIDAKHQAARHAMSEQAAHNIYNVGQVIGRGALAETPIIDFAPYLDAVPVANIHESTRPYIIRNRVRANGGNGQTMAMWRGVVVQSDGFDEIDTWVNNLRGATAGDRIANVLAAKPITAIDQCALGTVGGRVEATEGARTPAGIPLTLAPGLPGPDANAHMRAFVPEDHESGIGPCSVAIPRVTTPRIAAGGPMSDDVIKCQLKAVDPADYATALTSAQLAELADIFTTGVCDYTKPSVGDVERSILWPSVGGSTLLVDGENNPAPVGLQWRTARSS